MVIGMDPVFSNVIAIGLSVLFASAALHKYQDTERFSQILQGYRVIPATMLPIGSVVIPTIEIFLAVGLLVPQAQFLAALFASATLAVYSGAIWLNVYRGNLTLDCGCQFGTQGTKVSVALVLRNAMLSVAALALILPTTDRALNGLDYGTILFGLVISCLFYLTLNTLIANHSTYQELDS